MDQTYILRPYQEEAVSSAVSFLLGPSKKNAIEVLPTGSGKSLIIANIARRLGSPVLIFQPRKEILEQNYEKLRAYGYEAGIYSASKNKREISDITFATIGSVKNHSDLFRQFKYVIVDECHLVNSKDGMYRNFLALLSESKVLGLTATPYRLVTDGFGGSILKFLTRTRPRIFSELIYHIQNRELFDNGYLSPIKYAHTNGFDRSRLHPNSTGADFTDDSVRKYYYDTNFRDRIVSAVKRLLEYRKNVLVFARFVEDANYITQKISQAKIVTADTPKKEREEVISSFRSGRTRVVSNVGVLTVGFDYPELDTIVIARPTMSLALYYQMIGRGIRPHPGKSYCLVVDLCANSYLFGKIEDLELVDGGNGKWFVRGNNGKQLTNIYYRERN